MIVPEPAQIALPTAFEELSSLLDHHVLSPSLNDDGVIEQIRVARRYQVHTVVVRPSDVDVAQRELGDFTSVRIGSVVGFPHGTGTTAAKLYELRDLLRRGVREVDFMMNLGKLVSRQFQYVESEMLQAAEQCHQEGGFLKAVIESCMLDDEMKIVAAKICKRASVDMLATSTGFGSMGFTPRDLKILLWKCHPYATVKATHGVNTLNQALEARQWGAARLGTTRSAAILQSWEERLTSEKAS